MEIAPGSQIGPYVVDREIGRGGMGVVYAATDSRLGRAVAIKALPAEFAADPDRLARFEREARTLASLNHPNVAQIFGVEEESGSRYIVMELVVGETLAERLDRGPLPPEEAVELMTQVARGLGAAHDAGIVHRDLKPANIKLAGDGTAKVLDFGLARPEEGVTSTGSSVSQLPTMTTPSPSPTMAGAIMGTAPYMSPEQARGRKTDKRTDIWSFGVVLYECLTGAGPFVGETLTDSLGAILHKDVDLHALPAGTPAGARRALARCLERDRNRRCHDINDARIELESGEDAGAGQTGARRAIAPAVAAAALIAALAGAAATVALLGPGHAEPPEPMRFATELAPGLQLDTGLGAPFAFSPDGRRLVVAAREEDGTAGLWMRELSADRATLLPGTYRGDQPVFSPDGRWIAYFDDNALWKVAVSGGSPIRLCEAQSNHRGAAWIGMERLVFAPSTVAPLSTVDAAGGTPEPLTKLTPETGGRYRSHRWPDVSPDGRYVVYTAQKPSETFSESLIFAHELSTGREIELLRGGSFPRVLGDDKLVFARDGIVSAVEIDWSVPALRGAPRPVQSGVRFQSLNGGAAYALSQSGLFAYQPGAAEQTLRTVPTFIDIETGVQTPMLDQPEPLDNPSISPDGSRVAFQTVSINDSEILVYEVARKVMTRIPAPGSALVPVWAPDGERIAISTTSGDSAVPRLHLTTIDGESPVVPVFAEEGLQPQYPMSFSPDGSRLYYVEFSDGTNWDVLSVDPAAEHPEPEVVVATPAMELGGESSPDGEWIVYGSQASGEIEVYIRASSGTARRRQISVGGGRYPQWASDGSAIYYFSWDESPEMQTLKRVDLTPSGETLEPALPVEITTVAVSSYGAPYRRVALTRDAKRLLVLPPPDGTPEVQNQSQTQVVTDWPVHVRRVLETGG